MSHEYESYRDVINNVRNKKQGKVEPASKNLSEEVEEPTNLDKGVYTSLSDLESNLFDSVRSLESCLSGIETYETEEGTVEDVVIAPDVNNGITVIGLSEGLASDLGVEMPYNTNPIAKGLYRVVYPLFYIDEVITGNKQWITLLQELIRGGKLAPVEEMDSALYQKIFPTSGAVTLTTLYTEDLQLLNKNVLSTQVETLLKSYNSSDNKTQIESQLREKMSHMESVDNDYILYLPLTGQIVGTSLS